MSELAWRSLRLASGMLVRQRLDLRVSGAENVPSSGPVIIAARHYHHLYDGAAMMAAVPRSLYILVGLDWVQNPAGKLVMERLCAAASWPVVLRRDGSELVDEVQARRALRKAIREALAVLEAGHVLLVFPEGYPNIDPGYTPKQDDAAFLPFQAGFARLATLAATKGMQVPIVPAGFAYQHADRWRAHLRFGEPVMVQRSSDEIAMRADIEQRVQQLSRPCTNDAHAPMREE